MTTKVRCAAYSSRLRAYDITHALYHDIMKHGHGGTIEDKWYASDLWGGYRGLYDRVPVTSL